jgi:plasmid stability protein
MSDVLIRDVPDDVLAALDSRAARLGLSRNEYLRRQLAQDAQRSTAKVTMEDLRWFTETSGDLADPEVMRQAWT